MILTPRAKLLLAYLGVAACASLLIIGALAAIFEEAAVVRIYGGLAAVMALVVGSTTARRIWPRKPAEVSRVGFQPTEPRQYF